MIRPLHNILVCRGRRWLLRRHCLIASELATSTPEIPDILGFTAVGHTTLIECKTTRSDFLADQKKLFRKIPSRGMGDYRYYLTVPGVIMPDDLPAGWGLLELHGRSVFEIRMAKQQEKNARYELAILISALRRVGANVQGMSIKYFYMPARANRTVVIAEQEVSP